VDDARSAFLAPTIECMCVWQAAVAKVNVSSHTIANSQNLCAIHSNHCTIHIETQIGLITESQIAESRRDRTQIVQNLRAGDVAWRGWSHARVVSAVSAILIFPHLHPSSARSTVQQDRMPACCVICAQTHRFADRQSMKSRRPSTSTKVARHNQTSKF